jgi:ABC-2 type transport system permease protein
LAGEVAVGAHGLSSGRAGRGSARSGSAVLAAYRAELLVLRKWPAARALLLVTPVLVLATDYVAEFIWYLTLTPSQYGDFGSPAQSLPSMLPSQFNIISVSQFELSGTAPFIVLGAIMAGSDWGRGTIRTALLQAQGRASAFCGQALALSTAVAASVMATFAVAAGASFAILAAESHAANPIAAAAPSVLVIAESVGTAMLIAISYGVLGLALGALCRSAAGAISVAVVWTLIIESNLYNLGLYTGGPLRTIGDLTPGASAVTLSGLYGTPGGGALSQNYEPVGISEAVLTLLGYTVAALVITILVLRRRDVAAGRLQRLSRPAAPRQGRRALPGWRRLPAGMSRPAQAPAATAGVLASLRAELLIMRRRPAIWGLILVVPLDMLIDSYVTQFVLYRTANGPIGQVQGLNQQTLLISLMPSQYLTSALTAFGSFSDIYGAAVFMLLGALVGGSDWGRATIKAALLQGPGRLRTCLGQYLAIAIALTASVALTFLAAAVASGIFELTSAGPLSVGQNAFPGPAHLAEAVAAGIILSLAFGAIGLTLGVVLRSAGAAIGAVLLWEIVAEPAIQYLNTQFHGLVLRLYEILPDASVNTVVRLFSHSDLTIYGAPIIEPQVSPVLAILILCLYAVVFATIPAVITWRRDVL